MQKVKNYACSVGMNSRTVSNLQLAFTYFAHRAHVGEFVDAFKYVEPEEKEEKTMGWTEGVMERREEDGVGMVWRDRDGVKGRKMKGHAMDRWGQSGGDKGANRHGESYCKEAISSGLVEMFCRRMVISGVQLLTLVFTYSDEHIQSSLRDGKVDIALFHQSSKVCP